MKRLALSSLAATTLAFTLPALSHHAAAMFDLGQEVALNGTVREFQFNNPHCYIQLLVDTHGEEVEWSVEMGAPAHLLRAGLKPHTLKPGDKISLQIHPLRDGGKGGSYISGAWPDGRPIGSST